MRIDSHCHIDLYPNPIELIKECESEGIFTIAMTNLPSHFEQGFEHLLRFKKVRLALGLHPLYADRHKQEMHLFYKNLDKTSYIGEVGLDFSKEGISTKEIQTETFKSILEAVREKKKLLSIHSRQAEREVLHHLVTNRIKLAIFHWYSGSLNVISEIIHLGYYFSINPAMITSLNGRRIISSIPKEYILTESDGPYINVENRPVRPKDVDLVVKYLSSIWHMTFEDTQQCLLNNFNKILKELRP